MLLYGNVGRAAVVRPYSKMKNSMSLYMDEEGVSCDLAIHQLKQIITHGTLEQCIDYVTDLLNNSHSRVIPLDYVWQKCFLHACLKGRQPIAKWMESLMWELPEIERIGVRQSLSYGHFLLRKHEQKVSSVQSDN